MSLPWEDRTSNAQPASARLRRGRRRTSNQRARSALINSALPGFVFTRTTINLQNFGEGAEVRRCLAGPNPDSAGRSQRSVPLGGSLGKSALVACGTQSFHLIAQPNHSRSNAFVFLRD